MSNYNTTLQSNNTDLQEVLEILQNKAAGGGQATPEISVNASTGLVTAVAGSKSSTYQLAFQPAKTITPGTASQVAVSSGHYTGGDITVAAVPTQSKSVTPKATSQDVTPDSGKFLSKVTVNGDSNLVASNIKSGVTIFGVSGTLEEGSGEIKLQNKTFTENGTYTADSGYDGLGSVTVNVEGGEVDYSGEDSLISDDLTTYTNSRVTSIRNYAFYGCSTLISVSFPVVTSIGSDAFNACSKLATVSFPAVTSIDGYAFRECYSLTTVNFPVATTIGSYAFYGCSTLISVSFPAATSIGSHAFQNCRGLTTVNFPAATSIGSHAFYGCYSLTTVNFPVATTIGGYAFCVCSTLISVSFPAATIIRGYAFSHCYNLKSLYLTGSSVCKLSASNAFTSTPIGGYSTSAGAYGSIYVPASLLTTYQSATNWTYFSSRFVGV